MVKCHGCKDWDKEFMACTLGPYETEDVSCLLKQILAVLLNQYSQGEEGEDWKV